jgi:hypothetical protein
MLQILTGRHRPCSSGDVPLRDHRDLIAWRLANELRELILQFTSEGPASRDFKYRDQINDAISSVCRDLPHVTGARRRNASGYYRRVGIDLAGHTTFDTAAARLAGRRGVRAELLGA